MDGVIGTSIIIILFLVSVLVNATDYASQCSCRCPRYAGHPGVRRQRVSQCTHRDYLNLQFLERSHRARSSPHIYYQHQITIPFDQEVRQPRAVSRLQRGPARLGPVGGGGQQSLDLGLLFLQPGKLAV